MKHVLFHKKKKRVSRVMYENIINEWKFEKLFKKSFVEFQDFFELLFTFCFLLMIKCLLIIKELAEPGLKTTVPGRWYYFVLFVLNMSWALTILQISSLRLTHVALEINEYFDDWNIRTSKVASFRVIQITYSSFLLGKTTNSFAER